MAKKDKKMKSGGGGLSPKIYSGGLSKRRTARGSGTNRCTVAKGDTVPVQFLEIPKEMQEFDQHQFRDGGRWNYVPCAGEDCPLCEDDDAEVSKVHYRFVANVYNFKTKRCEVLEGPKTLAGRIRQRHEKKKDQFLKRTYDLSKLDGETVEWDVERSDEEALPRAKREALKKYDLIQEINNSLQRYYNNGEIPVKGNKTALDDDDYEEDEYDADDLAEMDRKQVVKIAKSMGIRPLDSEGTKRSTSKLIKLIIQKQG